MHVTSKTQYTLLLLLKDDNCFIHVHNIPHVSAILVELQPLVFPCCSGEDYPGISMGNNF